MFPNSSCETSITLTPKPGKDTTKKEWREEKREEERKEKKTTGQYPPMNLGLKMLNKILQTEDRHTSERLCWKSCLYPWNTGVVQYAQIIKCNSNINRVNIRSSQ